MNRKMFVLLVVVMAIMVLAIPAMAQESDSIPPAGALPCLAQGMGALFMDGVWVCTPGPVAQAATPNTLVPVALPTAMPLEVSQYGEAWGLTYFEGATPQMRAWDFGPLQPQLWPTFPDTQNPLVPSFRTVTQADGTVTVPDGLEFGMQEHNFCGAAGDECELVVPARGYVLISGDYDLPGYDTCTGAVAVSGCALMIPNVGEVSANLVGTFNNVWVLSGRYWNGDVLPVAVVAGLSHVVNNMTNGQSALNPNGSVNAGANCSVPDGCGSVRATFVVTSGNEALFKGVATYVAPADG